MKPVYAIATNIVSSLGIDTASHWNAVDKKQSGISLYNDVSFSEKPFWASRVDAGAWQRIHTTTSSTVPLSPFEQMAIFSAKCALADKQDDMALSDTVFILSSTKGNIEWLGQKDDHRILLTTSAQIIAGALGIPNKPIVVSHACVSGVTASIYALRLLQSGRYKHAVITGADRFTKFVLNGFQSFQAIADAPCKPFDKHRTGISLGEAAATIVLSVDEECMPMARILSGATSNDANHISGPSRTGAELSLAIDHAIREAQIRHSDIDMISAHGTATPYNDEMESKAFGLSKVSQAPLHSFKGYIGHTLGAAGVAEAAIVIEGLRRQELVASLGFDEPGVSQPLNITRDSIPASINYALKTASGFGGCNAVSIWQKA